MGVVDFFSSGYRQKSSELPCEQPPEGWRCTRERGHEGPCAALPTPLPFWLSLSEWFHHTGLVRLSWWAFEKYFKTKLNGDSMTTNPVETIDVSPDVLRVSWVDDIVGAGDTVNVIEELPQVDDIIAAGVASNVEIIPADAETVEMEDIPGAVNYPEEDPLIRLERVEAKVALLELNLQNFEARILKHNQGSPFTI